MPLTWAASVLVALGLGYYARDAVQARRAPVPEVAFLDSPDNAAAALQAEALSRTAAVPPQLAARPSRVPAERRHVDAPVAPAAREPPQASMETARDPALQIDGNIYAAQKDTARAVAGAVSIPSPVSMMEVVVTSARDADLAAVRGRQETTSWSVIERDQARQLLGADPVGVPGLAVREMRHSPARDSVVLVEQQVDSTTVIQLLQRRAEQPDVGRGVVIRGGTERLARFVGSLRVEIAGPLTSDSLNKLLEQLKPIP